MKKSTLLRQTKGFTLIEVLIVIAIVAGLAAVSYGVITSKIKETKIEEGNNVARELVFAFDRFEDKYDYPPFQGTDNSGKVELKTNEASGVNFLRVLMGKESSPDINPNNMEFFNAKTAENGVNGLIFAADGVTPDGLVDPFGNPYTIVINYDEKRVELSGTEFSNHEDNDGTSRTINATHIVAGSEGPDQEFQNGSNDEDDVKSW